jgi:triosephosphate isomerase
MRDKIIAGNWKMHGTTASINLLLTQLKAALDAKSIHCQVLVFAPFVYLPLVKELTSQSAIQFGAQTVSAHEMGAYTGEIAATMLQDISCLNVLVGHSERRQAGETNEQVAQQFARALEHGVNPMLCVGETLEQRQSNQTMQVVTEQIKAVIDTVGIEGLAKGSIAYEPIWAIGTGVTATPEQAQEVHARIRAYLSEFNKTVATGISILYGGSVKANNAKELFAMPDIDGALVGGASLDATSFTDIISAMN